MPNYQPLIDVAQISAAISEIMYSAGDEESLENLRQTLAGFPGVWDLIARASLSVYLALEEVEDQDCTNHDYIGITGTMGDSLLDSGHCDPIPIWTDEDLISLARRVVSENENGD